VPRTLGQAVGFLLGLWIALQLSPFCVRVAAAGEEAPAEHPSLEDALHEAVNATRAEHDLIPLRRDPELDRVARAHASDMARQGYLSHENRSGANPLDRLFRGGLQGFTLAAENVGRTNEAPPNHHILASWLASEVHRRNLLAAAFNATGLGIASAPGGALVYAQVYVTYPR